MAKNEDSKEIKKDSNGGFKKRRNHQNRNHQNKNIPNYKKQKQDKSEKTEVKKEQVNDKPQEKKGLFKHKKDKTQNVGQSKAKKHHRKKDVRIDDTPRVIKKGKVKIISLGGLNEIGKNITVLETDNDIIIIDCGLGFPDEDMLGIDLVIPDFSYLEANRDKVRGLFVTHGHEDHIGGIPYLLRTLNIPIYATNLTVGIIKNKLEEHQLNFTPKLNVVKAKDKVKVGDFTVEFIHVNHSIADACALSIDSPAGILFHTGDFKLDLTPIDGEPMDLPRIAELGQEGIRLLMCESTNAERPGYTPSEKKVGQSLEYIFATNKEKRIVIATFSSNVHRVQQIINISAKYGRKVAITGRSMLNIIGAAVELGYMTVPMGILVDIGEIKRFKPEELTLITTGSQGEPMSALYRMAFSDHNQVTLGTNDLVVLSSSPIPGNEKLIGRIINELTKNGVSVLHDAIVPVHVSGHACQEELKLIQSLLKPEYLMPIHGEFRHLNANRLLALDMGMNGDKIFISDIGKIVELDEKGMRFNGNVTAGNTFVDGYGVGDVGSIVLRDRRHLSQDGLIVVVASIDIPARLVLSGPDIVSRGFVYVRESEDLMDEIKREAIRSIDRYLDNSDSPDRVGLKTELKDDLAKYLYSKTKRKPMILPIIMDI